MKWAQEDVETSNNLLNNNNNNNNNNIVNKCCYLFLENCRIFFIFLHALLMVYCWVLKTANCVFTKGKGFFFDLRFNGSVALRRIKYIMYQSFLKFYPSNIVNTTLVFIEYRAHSGLTFAV